MRILNAAQLPPLSDLPRAVLEEMHAAGQRVLACERAWAENGKNAVSEILSQADEFYQWDHYPKGDVYCFDSHAQYYYHAHPPENRDNDWGDEHGHFHTFLRPRGFPENVRPDAALGDQPSHLVAVSMNFSGVASRLFTTNRWVTGEAWYDAGVVGRLLHHFDISHDAPSRQINVWISNLLVLFRPTIQALLHARDDVLATHRPAHDALHVHEDRDLEVASIIDIDVARQCAALEGALSG